ncbi:MAG: hypothetical protein LUO93_08035 [Methanomicrobiales archaeon]|nr:hypothetical protein [Methanomicrobiales archaeon]
MNDIVYYASPKIKYLIARDVSVDPFEQVLQGMRAMTAEDRRNLIAVYRMKCIIGSCPTYSSSMG